MSWKLPQRQRIVKPPPSFGSAKRRGLRAVAEAPNDPEGEGMRETYPRRPFVQVTVEVPASGTIDDVEPFVAAAGAGPMRAAVQSLYPRVCAAAAGVAMVSRHRAAKRGHRPAAAADKLQPRPADFADAPLRGL